MFFMVFILVLFLLPGFHAGPFLPTTGFINMAHNSWFSIPNYKQGTKSILWKSLSEFLYRHTSHLFITFEKTEGNPGLWFPTNIDSRNPLSDSQLAYGLHEMKSALNKKYLHGQFLHISNKRDENAMKATH